jgi:chromosome segregation ATPase
MGGGLILGLLKLRPEAGSLNAQASEAAVRSLVSAMEQLREELAEVERREDDLKRRIGELKGKIDQLTVSIESEKTERLRLAVERDAWKQRAYDLGYEE